MPTFTLQDMRELLQSFPYLEARKLCRKHKCFDGLNTLLSGNDNLQYTSVLKLAAVCKILAPTKEWDFLSFEELRRFFYTVDMKTIPLKYRTALDSPSPRHSWEKHLELIKLYNTLNKKTECDTQCSV